MNPPSAGETLRLNVASLTAADVNRKLQEILPAVKGIEITGCQQHDWLGSGFNSNCRLTIDGDLGDFCLCGVANAEVAVQGHAGCGLSELLESGLIHVRGNTMDAAGAYSRGGTLVIDGHAGRRTAAGLAGGVVIVTGTVDSQAGIGMTNGTLIVLSGAGAMLGQDMGGGTIYVRGEVESIAPHLEETRFKESDRLTVSLLLLNANLQDDLRGLRAFRVAT